jgi:O-antigen ligase
MTATVSRKILIVTLIMAVASIPLKNNWNSLAIVLFCLSTAIQQPVRESIRNLKKDHYWKLTTLFFLWLAATWFWDHTGGFSMRYLEPSASFVFLPLVMAMIPKLTSRELAFVCYSFIISIIIVCIICLTKSYMEYNETRDARVFFYHYLGFQMGLNAVYLSNYCIACITWLLYISFIYKGEKVFAPGYLVTMIACAFLFLMMFLLSSKMSLVLLFLLIFFMSLYIGYRKKALVYTSLIMILLIISGWFLTQKFGYLNWRIRSTEFKQYSGSQDDNNGLALRITTWTTALNLIKEKPILGYGLKGANEALVERYKQIDFTPGITERYNSHNQFMETTLRSGVVGLLLLLAIIAVPFISSIRKGKFLLTVMVLHFVLVSMVEGTLEIQQEFSFYLFFIFLFHYHYFNTNRKYA